MTSRPDEPLDLESMVVVPESTASEADPKTRDELAYGLKLAGMTAAKRSIVQGERYTSRLERDLAKMIDDNRRLNLELRRLEPRYAALVQARRGVDMNATIASVAMVVGSVSVGVGSVFTDRAAKWGLIGAGITAVVYGATSQFRNTASGWPQEILTTPVSDESEPG